MDPWWATLSVYDNILQAFQLIVLARYLLSVPNLISLCI